MLQKIFIRTENYVNLINYIIILVWWVLNIEEIFILELVEKIINQQ